MALFVVLIVATCWAGGRTWSVNWKRRADEEMLIPTMETVVYIGENLETGDEGRVYFQDIDSFNRGVSYDGEGDGEPALFHTGSKLEIGHVFTFEHALDVLLKCSLRRRKMMEQQE